jgi:hypothetical protein
MSSVLVHMRIYPKSRAPRETLAVTTLEQVRGAVEWPARGTPQQDPQQACRLRGGERRGRWPMILLVVPPSIWKRDHPLIWRRGQDLGWSNRFIRFATWAAVALSVALPAIRVYFIAVLPASSGGIPGRAVYAAVAVACCLPVQVWLVLSATRGPVGRRQLLGLAGMAAVLFGMVPVVGVMGVGLLYVLAALVLVCVRLPWSLLLFGALVAIPAPLTFALGHPEWAIFFTVGTLVFQVPLAVGMRLIRAARELQEAQLALGEQAVVGERLRIDGEVRESVGARLAAIAAQARRAEEIAARDPSAAVPELRLLVDQARRTLLETRRMVMRYREFSLSAELRTLATLLSGAGIDVRFDLPARLPELVDERDRESLRRQAARVLEETAPGATVTVALATHDGRPRVALQTGATAGAARMATG